MGTPLASPPSYGVGPPLPPLPPARPPGNRALIIGVAVVSVLLLLAVGALIVVSRPKDTAVAVGPSSTTSSTSPPSTSTTSVPGPVPMPNPTAPGPSTPVPTTPPGPAATAAEIEAAVADISVFVSKERGLAFKSPVPVRLVTDAEFTERLAAQFDEGRESREKFGKALAALGLIDPSIDINATLEKLYGASALGYYDPETKELVIRGVALTPFTRQTIAHELTHALDDQHYNLFRPEYEDEKDEIGTSLSAISEGDARRIEDLYGDAMSAADQRARDQEELAFGRSNPVGGLPEILLAIAQAPYSIGPVFVKAVVDHGGNDELAAAFTDPPRDSASILHPDRYFAKRKTVPVAKPKADGKEISDGVFGELMTRLMLEDGLDPAVAEKAADGWAGDWFVLWDNDQGGSCIRIDFAMVGAGDITELNSALTTWIKTHPGAKLSSVEPDLIELTSCSSAAGGGQSPL